MYHQIPGHEAKFDGSGLSSGAYFYQLQQEAFSGREDCCYCDEPGAMSLLLLFPLNIQERCQFLVVRQNNS